MTIERHALLISYLPLGGILWAAALLAVLAGTGCFVPALGLAPLALEASEMAGVGAIDAAGYAAEGSSHGRSNMDGAEGEERCDELDRMAPAGESAHDELRTAPATSLDRRQTKLPRLCSSRTAYLDRARPVGFAYC